MPFDKELLWYFKQFMGFKEQQVCGGGMRNTFLDHYNNTHYIL